jgi:hypothetical protein
VLVEALSVYAFTPPVATLSATVSRSESNKSAYTSSVIAALTWPSILCTTFTFAPARIASDAAVCRSACAVTPAAVDLNPDIVDECAADLDRLEVAPDAGAPTARTALRDSGARYSNDVIAAAVRSRKQRVSAVPDSG